MTTLIRFGCLGFQDTGTIVYATLQSISTGGFLSHYK